MKIYIVLGKRIEFIQKEGGSIDENFAMKLNMNEIPKSAINNI